MLTLRLEDLKTKIQSLPVDHLTEVVFILGRNNHALINFLSTLIMDDLRNRWVTGKISEELYTLALGCAEAGIDLPKESLESVLNKIAKYL